MISVARFLIVLGLILILIGSVLYLMTRAGISLARFPGDIRVERDNLTCVLALGTSLLLSVVLTLVLNLLARILNK
jgi:hypothetical protein